MQKNNMTEKVGQEATKEIYQEECKQADTATDINEEIKEEEVWKKILFSFFFIGFFFTIIYISKPN